MVFVEFIDQLINYLIYCASLCCHIHEKSFDEMLLMSTGKVCFCGGVREILCGYPLLSGAMKLYMFSFSCMFEDTHQGFDLI